MRFTSNIMEKRFNYINGTVKEYGALSAMKKLLAKGENGKFFARDFGLNGGEIVALTYLYPTVIKPTGVTEKVIIKLDSYDYSDGEWKNIVVDKEVEVKEWELIDYDRLKTAYELIDKLLNL